MPASEERAASRTQPELSVKSKTASVKEEEERVTDLLRKVVNTVAYHVQNVISKQLCFRFLFL